MQPVHGSGGPPVNTCHEVCTIYDSCFDKSLHQTHVTTFGSHLRARLAHMAQQQHDAMQADTLITSCVLRANVAISARGETCTATCCSCQLPYACDTETNEYEGTSITNNTLTRDESWCHHVQLSVTTVLYMKSSESTATHDGHTNTNVKRMLMTMQ